MKKSLILSSLVAISSCSSGSQTTIVKLTELQQSAFNECVKVFPARKYGYQMAMSVSFKCTEASGVLPIESREYAVARAMQKAAQAYIDPTPGAAAKFADEEVSKILNQK